jgi:predicted ATPase/class 3 adenylate cyclase
VAGPPTGTVTFLFTDIEGSTTMWERDRETMSKALARHDRILRDAVEERGGYVFKTVGDAFCCAFWTAADALDAALEVQRTLFGEEWQQTGPLMVRMALHTGAAEERDGDYFGPPVNRVARLLSAAHGGQVLLSLPTQELVRDQLPAGTSLRDLREHRLKDLFRPERVYQLLAPELPSEFPPLRTLDAYRTNLPVQPTPLVGREREVGDIVDRVRSEEARLLTLTGPGGTGKTRLALQAGADLLEGFDDGTFFIDLATITDPAQVPSAIAGPLGLKESAEQTLLETLKSYLHHKHLLLVLDNFEQVLDGAPIVAELLAACAKLKVLATSRIPLRLYGEQEYPVPPLAAPDPRVLPPLKALTQYEAVRLFVERARAIKPEFAVTNESAPAVAEICARLDGLPLAIELAAARVRVLPPQRMLQRLDDRLKLLRGGARDLPTRQQTLRGTIDWSHDLLNEEEKALFARLSVFAGGRTLEAIEEICDPEGDLDALEGVESLVEKSLLRQEEGSGGAPRFVMLETVHEYAREKLQESGEAEEVKKHHAEYFLALAEEGEPGLRGPEAAAWLERLEAEHDNLRAALSWALEQEEVELGLRLAGALWRFWWMRSHYSEGLMWLENALAVAGQGAGQGSPSARAMALSGIGEIASHQGDLDQAQEACEEGLKLLANEASAAKIYLLLSLGKVARMREDYNWATQVNEESVALSKEMRDTWGLASSLLSSALVNHIRGDSERATELYEESMDLFREWGDKQGLAFCSLDLGLLMISQGDLVRAQKLTEESVALFRELGSRGDVSLCLNNLGWIAFLRDDLSKALHLYKQSLALAWETGMYTVVLDDLAGFACLAGAQGDGVRAAQLCGAAEALHEATGYPQDPISQAEMEPYLASGRSQIHEAEWAKAWEEGRTMTLEEAVSYALEEEEASG